MESLPPELKLSVLHLIPDIPTLKALVHASPSFHAMYVKPAVREEIFTAVTINAFSNWRTFLAEKDAPSEGKADGAKAAKGPKQSKGGKRTKGRKPTKGIKIQPSKKPTGIDIMAFATLTPYLPYFTGKWGHYNGSLSEPGPIAAITSLRRQWMIGSKVIMLSLWECMELWRVRESVKSWILKERMDKACMRRMREGRTKTCTCMFH